MVEAEIGCIWLSECQTARTRPNPSRTTSLIGLHAVEAAWHLEDAAMNWQLSTCEKLNNSNRIFNHRTQTNTQRAKKLEELWLRKSICDFQTLRRHKNSYGRLTLPVLSGTRSAALQFHSTFWVRNEAPLNSFLKASLTIWIDWQVRPDRWRIAKFPIRNVYWELWRSWLKILEWFKAVHFVLFLLPRGL